MNEENSKKVCHPILVALFSSLLTIFLSIGFFTYYIVKNNPFNIQACIVSSFLKTTGASEADGLTPVQSPKTTPVDKNPLLSETQERALEAAGIDVEALPGVISPTVEACFVETLGQDKVNSIKAGATPSLLDIMRAKSCL